MSKFLELLNEHSTEITTLSSMVSAFIVIFTLLFTIIYVKATIKLVHIPYKGFVKISDLKFDNKLKFILENLGPSLAFDVKVKYLSGKSISKISDKKDEYSYQIFKECNSCFELKAGEVRECEVLFNPTLQQLFVVVWTSQTGKRYTNFYKYVGGVQSFILASKLERFSFKLFKIKHSITYPWFLIKYFLYFEEKLIVEKILELLRENQSNGYTTDTLADRFDNRNDDDIEFVIRKMIKRGMVKRIGFEIFLN